MYKPVCSTQYEYTNHVYNNLFHGGIACRYMCHVECLCVCVCVCACVRACVSVSVPV